MLVTGNICFHSNYLLPLLFITVQVSGAGIILWEDAWKSLSRLLTGSTLESIIETNSNDVLTVAAAPAAASSTIQSDEELARKLAEEWGTHESQGNHNMFDDNSIQDKMQLEGQTTLDSDEAFARALQAQWDSEQTGMYDTKSDDDSNKAVLPEFPQASNDAQWNLCKKLDEEFESNANEPPFQVVINQPARPPTPPKNYLRESMSGAIARQLDNMTHSTSDFEQFGSSFPLYHYNGLRGGTLTPFRVTRLNAAEAVGSSIGLSSGTSNHGSDDLEAVVRTKWPSCTFDWLGKNAPYID